MNKPIKRKNETSSASSTPKVRNQEKAETVAPTPTATASAPATTAVVKKKSHMLGKLANPPPEGLPREAVESFLTQVQHQLDLAKTLVDTNMSFDDAITIHRIIHDRLKELSDLGDLCIADWQGDSEEDLEVKRTWLKQSDLKNVSIQDQLNGKEGSGTRWTAEESSLFNLAVTQINPNQRGAAKEIGKMVTTKTYIQIRDRLRRYKLQEMKKNEESLTYLTNEDDTTNSPITKKLHEAVGEREDDNDDGDKEDEDEEDEDEVHEWQK
jgi:hypothetical protein